MMNLQSVSNSCFLQKKYIILGRRIAPQMQELPRKHAQVASLPLCASRPHTCRYVGKRRICSSTGFETMFTTQVFYKFSPILVSRGIFERLVETLKRLPGDIEIKRECLGNICKNKTIWRAVEYRNRGHR